MSIGNYVSFIGRFTSDPEIRTVGNGDNKVCNFTLARNKYVKDKDHPEADYVDCAAWNSTAELIGKYFQKGSRIGVSGSLSTRKYEDTNNVKRKVTEIIVQNIEFLDSKSSQTQNTNTEETNSNNQTENNFNNAHTPDDELPF